MTIGLLLIILGGTLFYWVVSAGGIRRPSAISGPQGGGPGGGPAHEPGTGAPGYFPPPLVVPGPAEPTVPDRPDLDPPISLPPSLYWNPEDSWLYWWDTEVGQYVPVGPDDPGWKETDPETGYPFWYRRPAGR